MLIYWHSTLLKDLLPQEKYKLSIFIIVISIRKNNLSCKFWPKVICMGEGNLRIPHVSVQAVDEDESSPLFIHPGAETSRHFGQLSKS